MFDYDNYESVNRETLDERNRKRLNSIRGENASSSREKEIYSNIVKGEYECFSLVKVISLNDFDYSINQFL